MEALARKHSEVKLRIVDVVSWGSEVAQQHGIRGLPTIWLYEDGQLSTKERGAVLARLNSLR